MCTLVSFFSLAYSGTSPDVMHDKHSFSCNVPRFPSRSSIMLVRQEHRRNKNESSEWDITHGLLQSLSCRAFRDGMVLSDVFERSQRFQEWCREKCYFVIIALGQERKLRIYLLYIVFCGLFSSVFCLKTEQRFMTFFPLNFSHSRNHLERSRWSHFRISFLYV